MGSAQEGHVAETLVGHLTRACPHAGTLDVDADEIAVGIEASHPHGIFTLAASELEGYGAVVAEYLGAPASSQGTAPPSRRVAKGYWYTQSSVSISANFFSLFFPTAMSLSDEFDCGAASVGERHG